MTEISFDKYAIKGAYHWPEYFGPVYRLNAYTRARYLGILAALRQHGVGAGDAVLDVGCGDGALTGLLVMELKANAAGVDTTALSIDLAKREFEKRKLAGDFRLIDGYRYPFADATYAGVVCSDVIEHVREPNAMLNEMWRVLSPGGILVVTTPVRYTEKPLDRMHVQEWFPDEFRDFCAHVLDVPVELVLSHPVALSELYASPAPFLGRLSRQFMNVLSKLGVEPFARTAGFRAFSTQTMIAKKPAAHS